MEPAGEGLWGCAVCGCVGGCCCSQVGGPARSVGFHPGVLPPLRAGLMGLHYSHSISGAGCPGALGAAQPVLSVSVHFNRSTRGQGRAGLHLLVAYLRRQLLHYTQRVSSHTLICCAFARKPDVRAKRRRLLTYSLGIATLFEQSHNLTSRCTCAWLTRSLHTKSANLFCDHSCKCKVFSHG